MSFSACSMNFFVKTDLFSYIESKNSMSEVIQRFTRDLTLLLRSFMNALMSTMHFVDSWRYSLLWLHFVESNLITYSWAFSASFSAFYLNDSRVVQSYLSHWIKKNYWVKWFSVIRKSLWMTSFQLLQYDFWNFVTSFFK